MNPAEKIQKNFPQPTSSLAHVRKLRRKPEALHRMKMLPPPNRLRKHLLPSLPQNRRLAVHLNRRPTFSPPRELPPLQKRVVEMRLRLPSRLRPNRQRVGLPNQHPIFWRPHEPPLQPRPEAAKPRLPSLLQKRPQLLPPAMLPRHRSAKCWRRFAVKSSPNRNLLLPLSLPCLKSPSLLLQRKGVSNVARSSPW